jgi:hypothetical protein
MRAKFVRVCVQVCVCVYVPVYYMRAGVSASVFVRVCTYFSVVAVRRCVRMRGCIRIYLRRCVYASILACTTCVCTRAGMRVSMRGCASMRTYVYVYMCECWPLGVWMRGCVSMRACVLGAKACACRSDCVALSECVCVRVRSGKCDVGPVT